MSKFFERMRKLWEISGTEAATASEASAKISQVFVNQEKKPEFTPAVIIDFNAKNGTEDLPKDEDLHTI